MLQEVDIHSTTEKKKQSVFTELMWNIWRYPVIPPIDAVEGDFFQRHEENNENSRISRTS